MEELGSIWDYGTESVRQLKEKLLHVTLELESANKIKMELLDLLTIAYEERDGLRQQLMKVFDKIAPSSSMEIPDVVPQVLPDGLVVVPAKANSSITESNSLSHGSSAVDSFFEAVSSPEFSNINVVDSRNVGFISQHVQEYHSASPAFVSSEKPESDPANVVIDSLIKGKALPQKGKLLQSVVEAGPLLQTLLVAGPLPSWRNPPPLQPIKVPPFTIKDFESPCIDLKPVPNIRTSFQKSQVSSPSHSAAIPLNPFGTCSASMLNFAGNPSGPWNHSWPSASTTSVSCQGPGSKRLRLQ